VLNEPVEVPIATTNVRVVPSQTGVKVPDPCAVSPWVTEMDDG
jgi:hypothetical protein